MAAATIDTMPDAALKRRYHPLVVVLIALAAGIVIDRFLLSMPGLVFVAGCLAWMTWLLLRRFGRDRPAAWALLVTAAAVGASWHHCCWRLFGSDELGLAARDVPQPVCVEAVALTGPRRVPAPPYNPMQVIPQGDQTRLSVRITGVRDAAEWRPASGEATLLIHGHLLDVNAGDRIQIFGQLIAPRAPLNPGEFNSAAHHRADRRLCLVRSGYPDCVTVLSRGSSWSLRRNLQRLRAYGNRVLGENLRREETPLAAAVLLGAREQLETERTEAFFETGTIHLLAISGLHVGILASFFFLAGRFGLVPLRWALLAAAAVTILYALLTDARPPVVRAMILVLVVCAALLLRRRVLPFNVLAGAAIVVLAINPCDLFRIGAQLSFLAVATTAWIGPRLLIGKPKDALARLIAETRPWPIRAAKSAGRWAWRITAIGAAIWLVALPLVAWRFHLVAPAAILLTPLLWFPMTVALFTGFGVLLFGWLIPPLAAVFGHVCDGSLWLLQWCVDATHGMDRSHFFTPGPVLWWVLGFYAALAFFVAGRRWRPPLRWCAAGLAAWLAVGAAVPMIRPYLAGSGSEERVDCTFLSVGHGTSVVLELPGGRTMLYDAGRLGSPQSASRSICAFLWSRGVRRLDAVVVSHADADHYNALPGVLKRFSVGVVYVSPVMFEDEGPAMLALRRSIEEAGVPIRHLYGGDLLQT